MSASYGNSTYTTKNIYKTDVFNVDWLYSEVFNETVKAEIEVHELRNETKKLLNSVKEDNINRKKNKLRPSQ